VKVMNDSSTIGSTEELTLSYDVTDEALEMAAAMAGDKAAALTVAFCTGLDSCPA
jgi:hypothetical protein